MNNYESIGKLSKPPLVYTASFLFISLPNIQEYIGKIQDRLRDDYPGFSTMEMTVNDINPITGQRKDQAITHYVMNDPDLNCGIVVTANRLIFQTVDYSHFKDFGEKFARIIEVVVEITKLRHHSGLAFRQVDNISAVEGEIGLSDCITGEFIGPELDAIRGVSRNYSRQEHTYTIQNNTSVIIRTFSFENIQGQGIPHDLVPLIISLNPDIMGREPKKGFMLADFEVIRNLDGKYVPMDTKKIVSDLDSFHEYASLAFRKVIKPDALDRRRM